MATMDITPQELRDIEIREAWRGYHRDDVDELLERAAATIEHLEGENAQLRSGAGGLQAAAPARAAAPVVAAAPVASPPVVAPPPAMPLERTADTDVIQRTLVLAQKAADEAVAEARAKASQIVSDSEARAQKLVADAETSARRIAETEKGRLEEDIAGLMRTRDTLAADVDELERFEQEYRERLRRAIHAELELLEAASAATSRPALHDIDVPASRSAPVVAPAVAADSGPSWSASQEGVVAPPAPVSTDATQAGSSTAYIDAVPAYTAAADEPAWDPAPAGGWSDAPTAALVDDSNEMALPADDYTDGDSLDDDAFFASLREAVRDDAPLGPASDDDTAYFDQDDTDEHRGLFKRRR